MTTQKSASLLVNDMLSRGGVPDIGKARVDGVRVLPGLSQWFRNPLDATALLVLGDSTGYPPGTTEGSVIGGVSGGYARWPDKLAQMIAASSLDITVRSHLWDANNGNNYYESPRVLKTATAGLRCARFPGLSNYTLQLANTNANQLTGPRHFIAAQVKPTTWTPANNQYLISKFSATSGNWSFSFGINASDGKLIFSYSTNGTSTVNRFSTVAPSGVTNNSTVLWLAVDVQWDNGSGGNTLTFYTSTDGRNWSILGTAVTNAGTLVPFAAAGQPYYLGSRGDGGGLTLNYVGDLYEVQVRKGGMYGPTILPTQPDQWDHTTAGTFLMNGGPQLDVVNAAWPGQGLTQFDDATNLPLMVPHYPYSGVILNTGHNDAAYNSAPGLHNKLDRVFDRVSRRAAHADFAVITQNPTLRTDGAGSGYRPDHTARMDRLAAYARARGIGVIDTWQAFQDYVLSGLGAGLADLLDPAGGPSQIIHPYGPGVTRQAQKVWDELGLGEAL